MLEIWLLEGLLGLILGSRTVHRVVLLLSVVNFAESMRNVFKYTAMLTSSSSAVKCVQLYEFTLLSASTFKTKRRNILQVRTSSDSAI